jgi:2,3-bisphosphoglycerate-dependent phosphoglycerate mutase
VTHGPRLVLVRHGESEYNVRHLLNGDPSVPIPLTEAGRSQVRALAVTIAGEAFDQAARSRFPRAAETLGILLGDRDVPVRVDPDLDDVLLGVFEGKDVATYRAWRRDHGPEEAPPGGESRLNALRRYTRAIGRLAETPGATLAVAHDIPIRFLANAVHGEDPLEGSVHAIANATPFRFEPEELRRGLEVMRRRLEG